MFDTQPFDTFEYLHTFNANMFYLLFDITITSTVVCHSGQQTDKQLCDISIVLDTLILSCSAISQV